MNQKNIVHNFLLAGIIIMSMFFSNLNIILASESLNVLKSDTILYLEEDKIPITVYKIENKDYVPLVPIINFFGMKTDFDNNNNQVIITQDEAVNTKREFYDFIDVGQHTVQNSTHIMKFYGNQFSVPDLKLVDNYNFIPVNELADFFGYRLLYDKIPNAVVMSNDYFYSLDKETLVEYSQYMKKNKMDFTLNNMESLKAIDFENYNVYLLGENHAISRNTDIKLSFIKFLHKNYGVRYMIDESGYCDTIMLNRFLQTGDISILEKMIESFKRTFSYTKENYDFYTKLYEFNQTLPENEKIVMVGIDVQHNWKNGLNVIKLLIDENKEMPDVVKSVFDTINKEDLNQDEMKSILDIVDKNESQFKQYLGDNYLDFYFGIRSIWQSMEFYVEDDFSLRERFIHENISDLYTMFGMQKCFGMFGGAHTMLNGTFDEDKNLAQYLNTEFEPTSNKVLSMMCMYENSFYMDKYTGSALPVAPNFGKILNEILAEAVTSDYGISPVGQISFEDGTLSDIFQYMICIKNSPASTPFHSLDK